MSSDLEGNLFDEDGNPVIGAPRFPYVFDQEPGPVKTTVGPNHELGAGGFRIVNVRQDFVAVQFHLPDGRKIVSEEIDTRTIPAGKKVRYQLNRNGTITVRVLGTPPPGPSGTPRIEVKGDGSLKGDWLINGLLLGCGHYGFTSQRGRKCRDGMGEVASAGFNLFRWFSSLGRAGEFDPASNWWVSPWDDTQEWQLKTLATIEEGILRGVVPMMCLFDEYHRSDRSPPESPARDRSQNTWNGRDPSMSSAADLTAWYLNWIRDDLRGGVLVELMNEPHEDDTWQESWNRNLFAEVRRFGYPQPIAINAESRRDDKLEPSSNGIIWEHCWPEGVPGKRGYHKGRLDRDRHGEVIDALRRLRSQHRGAHIGLSTDGCSEFQDIEDLVRRCFGEGFSFEWMSSNNKPRDGGGLTVAPDIWSPNERAIIGKIRRGAGL